MAGRRAQQPAPPPDSRRAAALRALVLQAIDATEVEHDNEFVRTPGFRLALLCCRAVEFYRRTADQVADELQPILLQLAREGALPYLDDLYLNSQPTLTLRETLGDWSRTAPHVAWWAALGIWVRAPGGSESRNVDPLQDFLACLEKLSARPSAVDLALHRVKGNPEYWHADVFGSDLQSPRRAGLRGFLAVARELSLIVKEDGEDAFFLPLALLAEKLHTDKGTLSLWRGQGVSYGFLRQVCAATSSRAARFQWVAKPEVRTRWIGGNA